MCPTGHRALRPEHAPYRCSRLSISPSSTQRYAHRNDIHPFLGLPDPSLISTASLPYQEVTPSSASPILHPCSSFLSQSLPSNSSVTIALDGVDLSVGFWDCRCGLVSYRSETSDRFGDWICVWTYVRRRKKYQTAMRRKRRAATLPTTLPTIALVSDFAFAGTGLEVVEADATFADVATGDGDTVMVTAAATDGGPDTTVPFTMDTPSLVSQHVSPCPLDDVVSPQQRLRSAQVVRAARLAAFWLPSSTGHLVSLLIRKSFTLEADM